MDISADGGEVAFAVYSTSDQPAALMNGAVDAISTPDPVATNAENEYGLKVLLDTAVTEPYASEYCCVSFVSSELAEKHPDIAAAFTRAVLKASAFVAENPEEDARANAEILKEYKYIPSVQGGYDALVNVAADLHDIGLLKESTDVSALVERSFKFFDGVPDSYTVSGDEFSDVVYESKSLSAATETHVVNDCCG